MPETPQRLGRYEVVRELGKGAMGVVYEGLDPTLGRRVAIKTARRDVLESSGLADEMIKRFMREAQAAGGLNHPNIITIYDAGEQDGYSYIAMEYLDGGDLKDMIHKRGRPATDDIIEIGATICDALAAAHEKGVVHRDIKPGNILFAKDGKLKVADFGIARIVGSTMTQEGQLIGTPHYMSPEQFMGQRVDGRSDFFSVAVMLYELLTGEKPFSGEALSTVMHHVIKTTPAPPSELNVLVAPAIDQVLLKALAKRPADRYVDGKLMAAALRESIKPKPNAQVLAGVSTNATVVAGGISADDKTLVKGEQNFAVEGDGQLGPNDRTVPSQTESDRAIATTGTRPPASKLPIVAGASAVAVLLAVVAGVLAFGGGGEGNGETKPPAVTAAAPAKFTVQVAGISSAAYADLATLQASARQAVDTGAPDAKAKLDALNDAVYKLPAAEGAWLEGASVEVQDLSGKTLTTKTVPTTATQVEIPAGIDRIKVIATADGHSEDTVNLQPVNGKWPSPQTFLLMKE